MSCSILFIKFFGENRQNVYQSLAFYLISSTSLIKLKHKHSCKILYLATCFRFISTYSLSENYSALKRRLDEIYQCKAQVEDDVNTHTLENRQLIAELSRMKTEMKRLMRHKDQLKR